MSFVNKITSAVASIGGGLTGTNLNINGINVTVEEKIADGGYGIIYKCSDNLGKVYALKALQAPDEEHYQAIMQEYEIHKRCADHPNIVQVYGMTSNQSTRQALILMEFCTDDLIKHINAVFRQGFDDRTIVEIFTEVCESVNHIHTLSPPVIHRDLKPENVLRNNGKWKLCDFGSATTRVYTLKTTQERNEASDDLEKNTTALYRSPEMCDLFRRQPINTKADVWALGCILYKLCTFKDAFGEGANLQILNVKYQWPQNKNINQKFKDICKYIFNTDPSKRPSARDVLAELYRQFPEWVDKKWQQETNTASSSEPFNPFANSQSNSQGQPFDPFGQNQNQNTQKSSSQNTFDPFGQQQQQIQQNNFPQRQNQRQEQFNPFAGGNNNSQSQETTFNPFAQQSSNQNSGTFDPFANVQQAPQQNSSDIKPPSGDGMPPMFNPFAQPQSQQQPRKQQQQPNAMYNPFEGNSQGNTGNDTFDPFSGLSSSNQQQQPVNPQEMFNPFENITPSPQNSGSGFAQPQPQQFNPFDGNSQTRQGPTHQPPKRGIASSMGFDPFGGAPSNAADTVSLMDTDSLLDSPSSSNQANTFATHNTPLQGGFDDISAFSNTQSPHRQPQSQQFHQQLSQPVHSSSNALDVRRAETDPEGFMRQIVNLNEFELSSILFSIHTSNNNSPFILKFLHMSGTNGPKVASSLPPITGPLGDVFASRRELSGKFPQFEGNFSITNFLRQHKENPVPIGQPPVCPESAKMLLSHIENVVSYVRASPTQVAGEEALISYQVTAYVLAKLKQFRINEGYIVNTAIPFFQNQYNQLKRAFTFIKPPMKFPPEPFNFNDENFLKRIRPPQPKSL